MIQKNSFKNFLRNRLFILFVISLIVRILYTSLTEPQSPIKMGEDDAQNYIGHALAFNDQGLFPKDTKKRYFYKEYKINDPWDIVAPGYPFVIYLFIKISKNPYVNLYFFQALISAFIPLLFFGLLRLFFNKKTSFLFALWAVIYYPYLTYTSVIMKEVFLFALFPLVILSMLHMSKDRFNWIGIVYCFSFIFLLYLDERFVIYLIVLPAVQFIILKIRNKIVFAQLIIILISLIPWEWHLFNVYNKFRYMSNRVDSYVKDELYHGENQKLKDFVFDKIKKSKTNFIRYFSIFRNNWKLHKNIIVILEFGLLLPFALLSVVYNIKKRNKYIMIFTIVIFVHFCIHLVLWGQHRYRYPTDIFIALLCFWALDLLLSNSKIPMVKKIRAQFNDY